MFVWIVRLCVFSFMAWTMSIPGTECYIAPQYWSIAVLLYWFITRKQEKKNANRVRIWPC